MTKRKSEEETGEEKKETALIVPELLGEVGSQALIKGIQDILEGAPDIKKITEEEKKSWERLAKRLASMAKSEVFARMSRAEVAEALYNIQCEQDWKILTAPHGKRYETWSEFRVPLAEALGISVSTIGRYLGLVRYGRQVLRLQDGEFGKVNGLVTVQHMQDVSAGYDARVDEDIRPHVRPKTKKFTAYLNDNYPSGPDEGYAEQLESYYRHEVAHDLDDPTALNKPPGELAAQAKDRTGEPTLWAAYGGARGEFVIVMRYPDREEDGELVTGEEDFYGFTLVPDFVPQPVIDWVAKMLKVRN